jgi:FlaA1/EpsC-like NDP-sugar epimerase
VLNTTAIGRSGEPELGGTLAAAGPQRHLNRVGRLLLRFRRTLIVLLHLSLIVVANYLAFSLRFDGLIPDTQRARFLAALPLLITIRGLTFVPLGLYQGMWRYTGLWEVQRIASAVFVSSAAFYAIVYGGLQVAGYPLSVTIIDALLLMFMIGAVRLSGRLYGQWFLTRGKRRALIVGAGDAGETIVRDMKRRHVYDPIGFIDDDPTKIGQAIHGVPVLGSRDDLRGLVERQRLDEVVIAIPGARPALVRQIVETLRTCTVSISTVPSRRDIIAGRPPTDLRNLSVEDLLTRAPVGLDERALRRLIAHRSVMVTGAGGSIGSELCRQIAALGAARLVLYERYENSLFAIATELADRGASSLIHQVVGDITDRARLDAVLREHRPEIIFHAAAHKHVPLMEGNPCEAVKNNVMGTRLLADAAERHRVRRFIFISSDKAVNPTSVMGATKRVAELILQTRVGRATSFSTVRFGNVLGSNGSVVPRFLEQIVGGGPVTVTHPEIRRYFMLISEAVHLVLHAAAQSTPGLVYVLDMGEQIKLLDLAKNLIRLSGFIPDQEIPITFVGLRPGEKLFEELVASNERVRPSQVEKVLEVTFRETPDLSGLDDQVSRLERDAYEGDAAAVGERLRQIVPEFATAEKPLAPISQQSGPPSAPVDGPACPACLSCRVLRSRTRALSERIRRSFTIKRLHRCPECGWRGWLAPRHLPVVAIPQPPEPLTPDFSDIDALALEVSSRPRTPLSAPPPQSRHTRPDVSAMTTERVASTH